MEGKFSNPNPSVTREGKFYVGSLEVHNISPSSMGGVKCHFV